MVIRKGDTRWNWTKRRVHKKGTAQQEDQQESREMEIEDRLDIVEGGAQYGESEQCAEGGEGGEDA